MFAFRSSGQTERDGISDATGGVNGFRQRIHLCRPPLRIQNVILKQEPYSKMKIVSKRIGMAAVAAAVFFGSANVMAQRQGGNFDPEQIRQFIAQRYQEALGVSGAEWAAIEPLVTAVTEKQRAATGGRGGFGGFGGRGGRGSGGGGAGGGRGGGEPVPEVEALEKAIEDGDAAAIKSKLAALRLMRKKAAVELQTARENLRKVLSAKQEAQLVLMGTLD